MAQLRQTHLYLAYVALITVAVIGLGAVLTRLSSGDRPAPNPTVVEAPESEASPSASSTTDTPPASTDEESPAPEQPVEESVEQPEPAPVESSPEPVAETQPTESAAADVDEPSDLSDILQPTGLDDDLLATTLDPSIASKPVRVDVELQGQSWVRVLVDGQQEYEGILQEGDQRTWAAENDVVIRAGNAGGVVATFNGTEPVPLGDPGAVSERRFSIEDIGTAQRAGQ